MPIMNLPQSVLPMLPFTVSWNTTSEAVFDTSILTRSRVPLPVAMLGSMSLIASLKVVTPGAAWACRATPASSAEAATERAMRVNIFGIS